MHKIAYNVLLVLTYLEKRKKNLVFAFEKKILITYNFDKFWLEPKFWLYFDL